MDLHVYIYKYSLLDELECIYDEYVESYEEAEELAETFDADDYVVDEE